MSVRIKAIRVKNFKGARDVELMPGDRHWMLIAGRNAQGKTSIIDAIKAVLRLRDIAPERPVHDGEKQSEIIAELTNGLVARRRFIAKSKTTTLEVTSGDGKLKRPQQILDALLGDCFLDPLEFMRLPEKKQRAALLKCVDVGIDLDAHAVARQKVYDERTDVRREAKRLNAELQVLPNPEIPEAVSGAELLAGLEELEEQGTRGAQARADVAEIELELRQWAVTLEDATARVLAWEEDAEEMVERHRLELAEITGGLENARGNVTAYKASAAAFREKSDDTLDLLGHVAAIDNTEAIVEAKAAILEATQANEERARLLAQKERRVEVKASEAAADAKVDELTDELEDLDEVKTKALTAAEMPIPGLDVDAVCVLYQGIPLSQASGAEQLQVSLALGAAMRSELDDIFIDDGTPLDNEHLASVKAFAAERNLCVWMGRVGDRDEGAVIIEDGMVKSGS